eukprot:12718422-Alexandrium_andersonii.AAC.1
MTARRACRPSATRSPGLPWTPGRGRRGSLGLLPRLAMARLLPCPLRRRRRRHLAPLGRRARPRLP